MSKVLENGNVLVNGEEYAPDTLMNMCWAECQSCGWHMVDNAWTCEWEFSKHECLTKAGKPRKRGHEGFMRACTALEFAMSKGGE